MSYLHGFFLSNLYITIEPDPVKIEVNQVWTGVWIKYFTCFYIKRGSGEALYPVIEPVDYLVTPDLLSFAEIDTVRIPCYSITQQIAEKIHAYTRQYPSGESSRSKDFVDILLLAELGTLSGANLMRAIEATFQAQGLQDIPVELPPLTSQWDREYQRNARQVGLSETTLEDAFSALQRFLNPVFDGSSANMTWHPDMWAWTVDPV